MVNKAVTMARLQWPYENQILTYEKLYKLSVPDILDIYSICVSSKEVQVNFKKFEMVLIKKF